MREILFRGKRTDNGEWIEGLLARYNPKFETANIVDEFELLVPAKAETVGQYTGLTDKNDKKIFEGDIVQYEDASADFEGYHDDVFLNRGAVSFAPWGGVVFSNRQTVEMDDLFDSETSIDAEVIGNIYDNPELLEG